ncbi:MAG TPA: hypothetical protein DFS52_10515 [Myxococcales bacterium]|jgi:predicted RNA-binding Zn-ribbon protein involved in translation (DUF1610 family)|nr:hypothetical protein [Myxococcales bacterium]
MARRCPICGEGEIREVARSGRRLPYRNVPDLEVPADLAIPTCSACGEELIDAQLARRLDERLAGAYEAALSSKADAAIRKLAKLVPQRDLEPLLGLSAGYLSKLKKGEKRPSSPLVAALMLLASDVNRLAELGELWRVGEGGAAPMSDRARPVKAASRSAR